MRKLDVETCTPSTAQNTVNLLGAPPWILIVLVLLQESIAPLNLVRFIIILSKGNTLVSTHLLLWDPWGLSPGPCDLVSWLHQCTISTLTTPLLYFSRSPSNTRVEGHVCACLGDRWMSAHHLVSTRLLFFHKKFLILTGPLNHCVLKHSARNKGVMLKNSCTWLVKVLILAGPWEEAQRFLPNQKVGIRHDMKKKVIFWYEKERIWDTHYMATGEPCAQRWRVMPAKHLRAMNVPFDPP